MEEVRQLVQEEGREARNLIAFHVAVDNPGRIVRKPPRAGSNVRRTIPRVPAARQRSASAGRDKRSELRARYWALLFGDLQRSIGEIYNTVETHENLSECQEVILVLENYTRDFKALGEWFRLKWEYDNTPPPQRPQSLAWEIRKTDFVRPESRIAPSSSPSLSGKNSPCLSGHNTPSGKNSPSLMSGKVSPGSGKLSPRICANTSPKGTIEFFSNKINGKVTAVPEPRLVKEASRLSDIKERNSVDETVETNGEAHNTNDTQMKMDVVNVTVELGTAKEIPNELPKPVIIQSSEKPIKMLEVSKIEEGLRQEAKNKQLNKGPKGQRNIVRKKQGELVHEKNASSQAQATIAKLDKMESDFLGKHLIDNHVKNDNMLNEDKAKEVTKKDDDKTTTSEGIKIIAVAQVHEEPNKQTLDKNNKQNNNIEKTDKKNDEEKKLDNKLVNKASSIQDSEITIEKCEPKKADIKPVVTKTAYSQAAAKPKITKETKKEAPKTTAPIARSKTVSDIKTNTNTKQFPRKNQTSKCSYPFNLTTGRTLFENNAKVIRKPVTRNTQMSSGDNPRKNVPKRPATLKIDDKKEDTNAQLEKIKDIDEYGSSDTVIDVTRIESSDSLKTLVADDNYNSVEVLNLDKNDNEGWLTVKSKRFGRESKKQKSHWVDRFNQPSATTSLPTLNMLESPKEENINILNKIKPKEDVPKTEPRKEQKLIKEKVENTTAILRQKSDVTGLRTRPARNKMSLKKADKVKDSTSEEDSPEIKKNRLHSSLESLSTALSRSQENTEETFDFDKWKEYYKSIKYLQDEEIPNHNEILETADPNEKNEIQEMTSQIEENERKIGLVLDFQNDVDQQKLCEEEDLLNRQILELQQVSDIDLGTETDDTETDAEILNEEPNLSPSVSPILESLGPLAASLEDRYEPALAGLSWAERIDTLATLEALVARYPGRAQQLHAKLSQGMRRRGSLQETLKRYQAKQDRAEKQRLVLQSERTKKIQQLLARVEEVKVAKDQLIEEKRARMDKRLQKAAQNRDQHLKDIVRKAHDEEEKLKEIAFIKQLEAEHRRHDFLLQCSTHTARLRELRRDRLNKLEQKAVREAAVVSRRSALEAARLAHVSAIQQRRRERDQRCEERKELLKQERDDAAREKAEGVKNRLEALAAAAELETDALRSRIQHKQDATRERLDKHLQAIRTKANTGRAQNTSESQEVSKESPEEDENKLFDKLKATKKRTKRLEQKLIALGEAFEDNNTPPMSYSLLQPDCNKVCKILCNLQNTVQPFLRQIPVQLDVEEMGEKDLKENGTYTNEVKDQNATAKVNGVNRTDVGSENDGEGKKKKKKKNNSESSSGKERVEVETEQKKGKNKKKNKEIDEIDQILFGLEIEERNGRKGSRKKNGKKNNRKLSDISDFEVEGKRVNNNHLVDVGYIERSLSELQRITDKNGKNLDYHGFLREDPIHSHQKIQGIRIMNFLLASAVDEAHVIGQLSLRTITTIVVMISRMVTGCNMGSAYFLGTNGCLNMIKLLIKELESEVFTDQNINLIMQIADCLSVTFDSVLVVTRVEEQEVADGNEPAPDDIAFVWEVRTRAHNMICYMCSGDAINRMESAGYAKEGIHTLLTMCANLCRPSIFDVPRHVKLSKEIKYSPLRQMACHSLRMCLGRGLGGARAEFCALFDGGAGLTDPGGVFVRAARTTRLLRALAELDYKIIQDAFSEGRWPLEFQASVSRLLAQHAPTDREDPRKREHQQLPQRLDRKLSETMVLDLIALIGYFVIDNPEHKSLFVEDTRYGCLTALKSLCSLPASWIMSPPHNRTLMPTLLALYDHTSATSFIAKELNCEMLEEYIRKPEASNNRLVQLILEHRQKNATAAAVSSDT